MPRALTPLDREGVDFFIQEKMKLWIDALEETDALRRNPGHAERTRYKMEEEEGMRFDLVGLTTLLEEDPYFHDSCRMFIGKRCRTAKERITKAYILTALSLYFSWDQLMATGSWPEHVALYALKEIGRALHDQRWLREIPEPCGPEPPTAVYLYNIDPLEPFACDDRDFITMDLSWTMVEEVLDNPSGIQNVIFAADDLGYYRLVNWGLTGGDRWWELQCVDMDSFQVYQNSMRDILRRSAFIIQ